VKHAPEHGELEGDESEHESDNVDARIHKADEKS